MGKSRIHCTLAAAIGAALASVPAVRAANPIRIMPLGDSITHGNAGYASYRYPLYYQLVAAGYDNFTFVGTQNSTEDDTDLVNTIDPATGQLAYPRYNIDFPKDNQGMSGYESYRIAQNVTSYAQATNPDIVLLMAGTNDFPEGLPVSEIIQSYKDITTNLRAVNPHVAIVLAELIPGGWCPGSLLAQLNAQIVTLPATLSTAQSPFLVVDPYTNFNVSAYTFDTVHTNVAGGQFMANIWVPAVESLLGPAPAVTSAAFSATTDNLWTTTANWSTRSPHVPGDTATFAAAGAGQVVHLDSVRTTGYLVFGNSAGTLTAGWTLDNNGVPSNVLTLATPSGMPSVTVNALGASNATISAVIAGTQGLQKSGVGTLVLSAANTYSGGTTINGGSLVFASAAARPAGDKLTINKDATSGTGTTVVIQGDAANLANYRTALAGSFVNNVWTNAGAITSSDAASHAGQGIGYLTGAAYEAFNGAFNGGTYGSTDMVLKYTFMGDATLDGRITAADYAQLDAGFLLHAANPTWVNGDFNYDGVVDYKDYALIDAAFASQAGASLAETEIAAHAAAFGAPYLAAFDAASAPVPEPATLAILAVAGCSLLLARRAR